MRDHRTVTSDDSLRSLLDRALAEPIEHEPYATLDAFWRRHIERARASPLPFDRAVIAGLFADTVGQAFTGGYRSAMQRLFVTLSVDDAASFCVTEVGGAHPRAIATTLESASDDRVLSGEKSWISLADGPVDLLVVARDGALPDGRPRLRVVHIDSVREGVAITPMELETIVPDVLHGSIRFDRVRVADSEVLEGDGYARYVKPFRTLEDIHVFAALLGYLLAIARRSRWPSDAIMRLSGAIATFRALAIEPPDSPSVHVALAGALVTARATFDAIEPHWESVEPTQRDGWRRDRALLSIAKRAREARAARALEALGFATAADR